jgi:hypothetical protein
MVAPTARATKLRIRTVPTENSMLQIRSLISVLHQISSARNAAL